MRSRGSRHDLSRHDLKLDAALGGEGRRGRAGCLRSCPPGSYAAHRSRWPRTIRDSPPACAGAHTARPAGVPGLGQVATASGQIPSGDLTMTSRRLTEKRLVSLRESTLRSGEPHTVVSGGTSAVTQFG